VNEMALIDKLQRKEDKVDMGDGEFLAIKSLTFPQLASFVKFTENKDIAGALTYLHKIILKQNFPDKSDSEIDELAENLDGGISLQAVMKLQEISFGEELKKKLDLGRVLKDNK